MKRFCVAISGFYLFPLFAGSQLYKFDFSSGKTTAGYIQVTPQTKFSYKKGYGFDLGSNVESVDRGGNALTGDFLTSKKPLPVEKFYWPQSALTSSTKPDGN